MLRKLPEIWIGETPEEVMQESAKRVVGYLKKRLAHRPRVSIVLSGGQTPRALYERLATMTEIDWMRVDFLFGDERYVPPDSPDSNVRLVQETLFGPLQIPPAHVFAIPTSPSPEAAAEQYQQTLHQLALQGRLSWDLVLLGLGPDGHTASLFPHADWIHAPKSVWSMAVHNAPKPLSTRITLTPAALNHARLVVVLATGKGKAAAVCAALESDATPAELPVRAIVPPNGQMMWMVDRASAFALTKTLG